MKIALVGALPPIRDGIADHNNHLFSSLIMTNKHDFYVAPTTHRNLEKYSYQPYKDYLMDLDKLKSVDLDLIHLQLGNSFSNSFVFKYFQYFKKKKTKLVITLHDESTTNLAKIVRIFSTNPFLMTDELSHPSMVNLIEKSTRIIVYSNYLKTILTNKFNNKKKFSIIFHGADVLDQKKDKTNSRNKLKIKKNDFIISSFGFITPRKGYEDVIKALYVFKKVNRNFKYFIIGNFNFIHYRIQLIRLINQLKLNENVFFTGYLPPNETREYLHASDILIQPRLYSNEGASGSLTTALSSGTVVITPKVGGFSEYITSGVTGILTSHDPRSYYDSILYLYQNKGIRKVMGSKAVEWIAKNISWSSTAHKHINLYENVVRNDHIINE